MTDFTSHLQPDGSTFPPLTPDPPPPPGYVDPLLELDSLMERAGAARSERSRVSGGSTGG
jgi:hypothetical protein